MDVVSYAMGLQAGKRSKTEIELLENVPISLDFSNGDQIVAVPDGTAVKSALIQKPATLVPENIAKGIDVAGIVGTHSGGGSNVATYLWEQLGKLPYPYDNMPFYNDGEFWVRVKTVSSGWNQAFYKYVNGVWSSASGVFTERRILSQYIKHNGEIHGFGGGSHFVYNLNNLTETVKASVPNSDPGNCFIKDSQICCIGNNGVFYTLNESSDTWTASDIICPKENLNVYEYNGEFYGLKGYSKNLYKLVGKEFVLIHTFDFFVDASVIMDGFVYGRNYTDKKFYKYDIANETLVEIGYAPVSDYSTPKAFVYEGKYGLVSGVTNAAGIMCILHEPQ